MAHIENTTPILRVADLEASKRYYLDVLGFALDWEAPHMISVSRNRKLLMLCHGHQGNPGTWVWIGCSDVDTLLTAFTAKGAVIRDRPQNFEWAYEMQVQDPDGHVLRFGSEPKDAPFGEFKP